MAEGAGAVAAVWASEVADLEEVEEEAAGVPHHMKYVLICMLIEFTCSLNRLCIISIPHHFQFCEASILP